MPKTIPAELQRLLKLAQQGVAECKLVESIPCSDNDIAALKHKKFKKVAAEYPVVASRLVDYLLYTVIPAMLSLLSEGAGIKSLHHKHSELAIEPIEAYLGKTGMPDFVDDERLYQKMLWIEWFSERELCLIKQKVVEDFGIWPFFKLSNSIKVRLDGVKKFIADYVKVHPGCVEKLAMFRHSYVLADATHSYEAAFNALAVPKIEPENPVLPLSQPAVKQPINDTKEKTTSVEESKAEQSAVLAVSPVISSSTKPLVRQQHFFETNTTLHNLVMNLMRVDINSRSDYLLARIRSVRAMIKSVSELKLIMSYLLPTQYQKFLDAFGRPEARLLIKDHDGLGEFLSIFPKGLLQGVDARFDKHGGIAKLSFFYHSFGAMENQLAQSSSMAVRASR